MQKYVPYVLIKFVMDSSTTTMTPTRIAVKVHIWSCVFLFPPLKRRFHPFRNLVLIYSRLGVFLCILCWRLKEARNQKIERLSSS